MRRNRFFRVLKMALLATLAAGVFSFLTMSLWNGLMPAIFGLHVISFWQALGLLVLSKLLFGGFRPLAGGRQRWRGRMMERWEQMTPEQREKFKEGMRGVCGGRRNMQAADREAQVRA